MQFILFIIVSVISFIFLIWEIIHYRTSKVKINRQNREVSLRKAHEFSVSLSDLLEMQDNSFIPALTALRYQKKTAEIMPDFDKEVDVLIKKSKDIYFNKLLTVLARYYPDKIEEMNHFMDYSTNDILLTLLMDSGLDNQTIANLLMITQETLKKRRQRLRDKILRKDDNII